MRDTTLFVGEHAYLVLKESDQSVFLTVETKLRQFAAAGLRACSSAG
jgi:hypothetical protein